MNHGLIPASRQRLIDVAIIAHVNVIELAIIIVAPIAIPNTPVKVNTKNNNVTNASISHVAK